MSYFSTLQSVAGANLLAHWKLDDNNGSVVADSANNYDLTLVGTNGTNYKRRQASIVRNDTSGYSMWFDGTSGHAYRNATTALDSARTAYTLIAWCQVQPSYGGSGAILAINNKYRFQSRNDSQFESIVTDSGSSDYTTRTSLSDFAFNKKSTPNTLATHMVVMVLEPWTANTTPCYIKIYVNGHLYATNDIDPFTDNAPSAPIGLANVGNGGGNYFYGWLQHVSVITTNLSQSQVHTLYQAGVGTPVANAATVYPWTTEIVASDPSRKRITITNDSHYLVSLSLGGTPSYYKSIALRTGERWTSDTYNGSINASINPNMGYADVTVMSE